MKKRVISGLAALVLALSGSGAAVGNFDGLSFDIAASAEYSGDDYIYNYIADGVTGERVAVSIDEYIGDSTNVIIPSEIDGLPVTTLGEAAFKGKEIDRVVIPNSVKSLSYDYDYGVFSDSTVRTVILPDSLDSIPRATFMNCASLESIIIPSSITKIGYRAFFGCTSLTNVTLNEGLFSIGDEAFKHCTSLKTILVPKSVKEIGVYAFGYRKSDHVMEDFTLQCYRNGIPYQYALSNSINYEIVSAISKYNPDITATAGTNSVSLNWNTVKNAQKYAVCGYSNGVWNVLAETADTSYEVKKLKTSTNYKFAVIAMFEDEWYPDYSNAKSVTTKEEDITVVYPEVTGVYVSRKTHQARVEWEPAAGAERYCIAILENGKWNVKSYVNSDTFELTTPKLTPGTIYTFAICARFNGKWDTSKINSRAFNVCAL